MKSSGLIDEDIDQTMIKTAFLSYYISTYNAVNEEIGFNREPVTVDEIFDFINDLKHECGKTNFPTITKKDILLTFHMLANAGVCKKNLADIAHLVN